MSAISPVRSGFAPSVICPTADDRERFLDMNHRMLPTQNLLRLVLILLLVPGLAVTYRPVPLGIILGSVAGQSVLQKLSERFHRPEIPFALAIGICLVGTTAGIVIQGREGQGDLAILIWAAVTAYSRFPTRVAHGFTATTVVLMLAPVAVFDPHTFITRPLVGAMPVVAMIAVGVFAAAVRDSDARHRREAIVDQLTGLLNRTALRTRVGELQAQARLSGDPVGLILLDLDHFKSVNDLHGHAKGDEVLAEISVRLRGVLRAYDSIYRIGGEELAVVVPGATREELSTLSERLRIAVHEQPVAGLDVTISVGATRSQPGAELDWDELYRAADRALYRAKADGRDRVALD